MLKLRKLGFSLLLLGLALPSWSTDRPGTISGYVRGASGIPQMGAVVEVLGAAAQSLRVFTDENGFYSAAGLLPGVYNLKVSAPAFLPALREHVGLHAGGNAVVNVTLSTIFEAIQIAPTRTPAENDDWKWVLRSVSNRPILRMVDDPSGSRSSRSVSGEFAKADRELKGTLSFLAGSPSEGFGSASDMSTGFSMEKSIFSSDTVGLRGNVGYGNSAPSSVVRGTFQHQMENGSAPSFAVTMWNLPAPDLALHGLQSLALTTSDDLTLGDVLELKFGSELQTIEFMGRVTTFRPFGTTDLHLSPNTVIEYRYATSEPGNRMDKGFESEPGDVSESMPHVTMTAYATTVEHAHHQELSLSHRIGKNNMQVAAYTDRVSDPALIGVGEFSTENGNVLPDLSSGTFTYQGNEFHTQGMRLVLQHQFSSELTGTFDYEYGGVLDLARGNVRLDNVSQSSVSRKRQSIAGKLTGTVPKSNTHWMASYRFINGEALTPIDMFNASAGRADPYLNLFFRQPIPGTGFFPGHIEAIVDLRNLLAQGYVPVLGHDGHTVYLVQSAKTVSGGVAFTF
ncbi:MAG TPA: carboxypeptidase-like regulatory domain-containing protein [Terriglobales bacterium]|nr:carboxypeptidase-like regulatory domain-containing protein [Terriglobales bacterium]